MGPVNRYYEHPLELHYLLLLAIFEVSLSSGVLLQSRNELSTQCNISRHLSLLAHLKVGYSLTVICFHNLSSVMPDARSSPRNNRYRIRSAQLRFF